MGVFVIAEAACTWRYGDELETAKRSIAAAKACGADAWKTQWCSDGKALAKRRNIPQNRSIYEKRLQYPSELLESLKSACSDSGIEFMCTVYLPQDISVVAKYVKRFKISAFESQDAQFIAEHLKGPNLKGGCWSGQDILISLNSGKGVPMHLDAPKCVKKLYCISLYPTSIEQLHLTHLHDWENKSPSLSLATRTYDGLSDHTTSTLTGAVAVGCGARIIEKHVRLFDTPDSDPDYKHSLVLDEWRNGIPFFGDFGAYVKNIRLAEQML